MSATAMLHSKSPTLRSRTHVTLLMLLLVLWRVSGLMSGLVSLVTHCLVAHCRRLRWGLIQNTNVDHVIGARRPAPEHLTHLHRSGIVDAVPKDG